MIDKTRTSCMTVTKGDSFDAGKVIIRDGSIVGKKPPYNKDDLIDNKIWYIEYF